MPKVTEEYIENKKTEILDAALAVFRRKPLYEMTMLDVIKEAGLSRGGIYRYFSDIDDVLVALINRETKNNSNQELLQEVGKVTVEEADPLEALFRIFGEYLDMSSDIMGKIQFELTVLAANHPNRIPGIIGRITEQENGQYMVASIFNAIIEGVAAGKYEPQYPIEELLGHIKVHIEGLIKILVLERCYSSVAEKTDPVKMMGMLHGTVRTMLQPA